MTARQEIEDVKTNADLIAIAGRYTNLRQCGADDWVGCCPIHDDDTPSFHVHREYWKCFGCQEGGDVFALISACEGISFTEAKRRLSSGYMPDERAILKPVDTTYVRRERPKNVKAHDTRTLEQRGVTKETMKRFGIVAGSNSDAGTYWTYPTYHIDGKAGRPRRKFQSPGLPKGSGAKYVWLGPKEAEMPVGYNLGCVREKEDVWLLNGEVSVWLLDQSGVRCVCSMRSEAGDNTALLKALRKMGVSMVHVLFDNDKTGRDGAVKCLAKKASWIKVHYWPSELGLKEGYDAADYWQDCRDADKDIVAALEALPVLDEDVVEGWSRGDVGSLTDDDLFGPPAKLELLPKIPPKSLPPDEVPIEPSSSYKLMTQVIASAELFVAEDGESYLTVDIDGHRETHATESAPFRFYLQDFARRKAWNMLPKSVIESVSDNITGIAHRTGAEGSVSIRTANFEGRCYIDLADRSWRVIEIGSGIDNGWRIIERSPVPFSRPNGMQALPVPEYVSDTDSVWNDFRENLSLTEIEDFQMVVSWMVAALGMHRVPFPVLYITGTQGSGKSDLCELVKRTIDPNFSDILSRPKSDEEMILAASNMHVFCLDNLSTLPDWASDVLAKLATGSAYRARKLYSNNSERMFKAIKPQIVNGIPNTLGRPDLRDRMMVVNRSMISEESRRRKEEVRQRWLDSWPRLLGAICTAIHCGLVTPEVVVKKQPRMADYAGFVRRCEAALPWEQGSFMEAFNNNSSSMVVSSMDGNLFISSIQALMRTTTRWSGSTIELMNALRGHAIRVVGAEEIAEARSEYDLRKATDRAENRVEHNDTFPKTTRALNDAIRRWSPDLMKIGLSCGLCRKASGNVLTIVRGSNYYEDVTPEALFKEDDSIEEGTS